MMFFLVASIKLFLGFSNCCLFQIEIVLQYLIYLYYLNKIHAHNMVNKCMKY